MARYFLLKQCLHLDKLELEQNKNLLSMLFRAERVICPIVKHTASNCLQDKGFRQECFYLATTRNKLLFLIFILQSCVFYLSYYDTSVSQQTFSSFTQRTLTHIQTKLRQLRIQRCKCWSKKRNCVYDNGIKKKTLSDVKHTKLGSLLKTFFKEKNCSFKMCLGLDNTMRQKHMTYLFPKSQNDIVKYTFLSTFCVCTPCWRTYFSRVTVYSEREKKGSFSMYCYDLQKI